SEPRKESSASLASRNVAMPVTERFGPLGDGHRRSSAMSERVSGGITGFPRGEGYFPGAGAGAGAGAGVGADDAAPLALYFASSAATTAALMSTFSFRSSTFGPF